MISEDSAMFNIGSGETRSTPPKGLSSTIVAAKRNETATTCMLSVKNLNQVNCVSINAEIMRTPRYPMLLAAKNCGETLVSAFKILAFLA